MHFVDGCNHQDRPSIFLVQEAKLELLGHPKGSLLAIEVNQTLIIISYVYRALEDIGDKNGLPIWRSFYLK